MNWEKLYVAAGHIPAPAMREGLARLARHPDFVALVAMSRMALEDCLTQVAAPHLADSPGRLAHASGALSQALMLMESLKRVVIEGFEPGEPIGDGPGAPVRPS